MTLFRRAALPLAFLIAAMAIVASSATVAQAERRATRVESKAMWKVVDPAGKCFHRRGRISTAHTPRLKYGTVVIADAHCGNGQVVLSRPRHRSGHWRALGSGSDWGYPGRCKQDLKKIPRKVLEDFFGAGTCAGGGRQGAEGGYRRCRDVVIRNPTGGIYTQTQGLFEKRTTCRVARRLAHRYLVNDGVRPPQILGFTCDGGSDGVACRRGRARVTWGYTYDRSARVPPTQRLQLNRGMAGVRLGDSIDRLHRVLGEPRGVDYVENEITGSMRIDVYGNLSFTSYEGSILGMKTARRSIRTPDGIGVGTTKRRLGRELPGLSCYRHRCSIVAGGGLQTIGKRVTTFQMRRGKVRVISIGRVID